MVVIGVIGDVVDIEGIVENLCVVIDQIIVDFCYFVMKFIMIMEMLEDEGCEVDCEVCDILVYL